MHLTARIRFTDLTGQESWITVPAMQKVIVGSSPAADVQLYDPRNVLQKHCEVEVNDGGCQIRSLATDADFEIDGRSVREFVLGDKITEVHIGQNEIEVHVLGLDQIQEQDYSTNVAVESAPEFTEPELHILANGLRCFQFPASELDGEVIRNRILLNQSFFATHNARANGQSVADGEFDLLEEFPDDFRADNSITFHGPFSGSDGNDTDDFSRAIDRCMLEANSLIIVPKDQQVAHQDFLDDLRLLIAWLVKPSTLDFHLANGIDFLLETIFSKIDRLVYFLDTSRCWKVVTKDSSITDFSDLIGEAEHA